MVELRSLPLILRYLALPLFTALAIAAQTYGLKGAVSLRVIQNVFGVAFALVFCILFYWMMSKSCKLASNQV